MFSVPDYIKQNYKVFDRFKFDYIFKRLLRDGYDHDEAKDIIIHNCALSALVFQERVHNEYYFELSVDEIIAPDLLELQREICKKVLLSRN